MINFSALLQKITAAMKMVAVCKLRAAQLHLDAARDFAGGLGKVGSVNLKDLKFEKPLYIGVAADKGLCGAINSSIVRSVRDLIDKHGDAAKTGNILCIGEKSKQGLERRFSGMFKTTLAEAGGTLNPTFRQVSILADYWMKIDFDVTFLYFQKFKSMIAYNTTQEIFLKDYSADKFADFEMEGDPDIIQNFMEFRAAVKLYYFMAENQASTLSSRMNAMDNSSKNAGEMIDRLQLLMNRTRQAKITTELTEIISGAAAVQ